MPLAVPDLDPRTVLVVLPVQNEAASLAAVLAGIRAYGLDVLVVDDASHDDSLAIARAAGVKVLPLALPLGAWGAIQTGIRYARQQGYAYVLSMDADGQHHSEEIPVLIEAMRSRPGADLIIGACIERGSWLRHLAWHFFRRLTGIGIEDLTSGFRLYNARALAVLSIRAATLLDYQDVGVLLLLKSAGLHIEEVRVNMTPRENGVSRVFSSWMMVLYYILVTTVLSLSKMDRLARRHYSSDQSPLPETRKR
ncbi:MAG: glycosyltransferase family 2 protein [Pseudomonadales bacterium]|nr:glycosyltransferase family 2 protein [Pseudomonadales bacterium]